MRPGDERELREAYAAHSDQLYGFALRVLGDARLADGAVQETFLRAWRTRDRLDPDPDTLRIRLLAILHDLIEPPEHSLRAWQIEEAMRTIDDHHRQILIETHFHRRPYAELATELGVPEATIKSRVHAALRSLKPALEKVAIESPLSVTVNGPSSGGDDVDDLPRNV